MEIFIIAVKGNKHLKLKFVKCTPSCHLFISLFLWDMYVSIQN